MDSHRVWRENLKKWRNRQTGGGQNVACFLRPAPRLNFKRDFPSELQVELQLSTNFVFETSYRQREAEFWPTPQT